ncbi:MAG: OmpA family protein [Gemmatimonadaceae bacterium]
MRASVIALAAACSAPCLGQSPLPAVAAGGTRANQAASVTPRIPLVRGLTMVSVLHRPDGDRENTVEVQDVSAAGATYAWRYRELSAGGQTDTVTYRRFVSAADLAGAPRMNAVFRSDGIQEVPGYTAFTLSRGLLRRVQTEGPTTFTLVALDEAKGGNAGGGAFATSQVPYRGALSLVSRTPEPLSLLVNGKRTAVPTLHLTAKVAYQERKADFDVWVLADSVHPLIVKTNLGPRQFLMIRVDLPGDGAVESELASSCRAELPGIYFAFASAELQPASDASLGQVGALLKRHAEWSLVVEGHTDSIGDASSNRALSMRRAEAVRTALIERYAVPATRLRALGFGDTHPREPNATIEGRARNRRVELTRACPGRTP